MTLTPSPPPRSTEGAEQTEMHTPGPWHAGRDGNNRVYGPDGEGTHAGLIAVVYKGAGNKHLIAAAPDLLDTLKAVRIFIRNGIELGFIRMPDPETNDPASLIPERVRAALAKVEGHE